MSDDEENDRENNRENDLIIDLMKDMRDESRKHANKSAAHCEESRIWQVNTANRLENIEKDLREHKEGVIQNRETMGIFDKRLEFLEAPIEAKKYLYKKYMKIGGIISITLTIIVAAAKIAGLF